MKMVFDNLDLLQTQISALILAHININSAFKLN